MDRRPIKLALRSPSIQNGERVDEKDFQHLDQKAQQPWYEHNLRKFLQDYCRNR